jgi:hypothetical protein
MGAPSFDVFATSSLGHTTYSQGLWTRVVDGSAPVAAVPRTVAHGPEID